MKEPYDVRTEYWKENRNMPAFVFDIETVPDLNMIDRMVKPDPKLSIEEKVEATYKHFSKPEKPCTFLPYTFHRILCIGYLIRTSEGKIYKGVMHNLDEKKLMQEFAHKFSSCVPYPRLISFNGKNFDMPVVALRLIKHGVKLPILWEDGENCKDFKYGKTYYNKYNHHKHLDLSDQLVHFAWGAKPSLNACAHLLEVPQKTEGVSGADVAPYHFAGKDKEICDYCAQDVLVTYRVYLKLLYSSTFMTDEEYNQRVEEINA